MSLGAGSVGRVFSSALLAGLIVTTQAVVAPVPVSAKPTAAAVARPAQAQPHQARKLAADPHEQAWRSKFVAHPVPAPRATARNDKPVAVQQAPRRGAVDACSGPISADTLYSCQSPSPTDTDTYTLTLAAGSNVLVLQVNGPPGFTIPVAVTDPDGGTLSCHTGRFFACATSEAGTYTVAVTSDGIDYTLEFTELLTESDCPAADLSFAASSVTGSLTAGQPGACYSLSAASGHNLFVYEGPFDQQADVAIFDAAGDLVCEQLTGACTLTGSGPYRVLVSNHGGAGDYEFQIADLTDPAGCAQVTQQHFGVLPPASGDLCGSITVTSAGSYQVYAVAANFATFSATLYQPDGTPVCTDSTWSCQLAPGTYNLVQDFLLDGIKISTVFIATTGTQGCTAASDTSFASGDATGTFAGPGQEFCRTLPTKAGLADYLYSQPVSSGTAGEVLGVEDATGAQVCPDAFADFSFGTCALTGTAPFRVILVPGGPDSQIHLLVQRTDSTAGCAAWPRSKYGTAAGVHLTLTKSANVRCLSIPAASHSTSELVEDADATDGASAALLVNDPSGSELCGGNENPTSWSVCDYKTGVNYTAILINFRFFLNTTQDTYGLARRDLTSSAACSSPASTTPGGPSTSFALGSSLAARCFRISAAKTDKLLFSMRGSSPADPTVFNVRSSFLLLETDSGLEDCFGFLCQATGSTSYLAVVFTQDYTDVAITEHLDAWRVGTSAGWAPQCQKHVFSVTATSAAVSDTLTDKSDLYCGVLNIKPNRDFSIYGSSTALLPNSLLVDAFTASSFATPDGPGLCSVGGGILCAIEPVEPTTQALLVVTPFDNGQTPISFDLQGVCGDCAAPPPVFKSVSPASQPAGPNNTIVVTGTGLNFKTPFELAQDNGAVFTPAVPVSVNAAGTRLTLRLDTSQVPPGLYGIAASRGGSCTPDTCPGELDNAYKVTAGPAVATATRFVPLTPTRILHTTSVAARKTLTFPVTGRSGVPSAQVATVTLDVSALAPAKTGFLTVFEPKHSQPPAETVPFKASQSSTNLVTVPVVNGQVSVANNSPGRVGLAADVVGYSTAKATAGTGFTPVGPVRILKPVKVTAGHAHVLTVAGAGGIPKQGTEAVALNVTVTGPAKAGQLITYPDNTKRPAVTSLSFAPGQPVTGLVIARVTDGKVDLYDASKGGLQLTVDAVGYYSASASGSFFRPVDSVRVMDTRTGFGQAGLAILPHAAARLNALWDTPLPNKTVTAVVLNVTVLNPGSAGALTAFPDGVLYEDGVKLPNSTSLPGTPNLAFAKGQTQSDLVIVPSDEADFYNGSASPLQIAVDLEGYYTAK